MNKMLCLVLILSLILLWAARFETNDLENSEAARMQTTNQKIFSASSTAIEKKPEDPRGPGSFFYIGGSNGAQL